MSVHYYVRVRGEAVHLHGHPPTGTGLTGHRYRVYGGNVYEETWSVLEQSSGPPRRPRPGDGRRDGHGPERGRALARASGWAPGAGVGLARALGLPSAV